MAEIDESRDDPGYNTAWWQMSLITMQVSVSTFRGGVSFCFISLVHLRSHRRGHLQLSG